MDKEIDGMFTEHTSGIQGQNDRVGQVVSMNIGLAFTLGAVDMHRG